MKVSLKWLNNYVDCQEFFDRPERLSEILTAAGLEVENLENRAKQFAHVVVGHILELGKHPDADKLTLCKVDTGQGEPQQIVCGAKNHKQGDKVVAATPGAILPGDFKIKKSKIRGVESLGMLCSEVELGLANESDGIMILPPEAEVGKSFADYQGLNDVIFDLSVTPNRADCLSHWGLARELAGLLNRSLKKPNIEFAVGGAATHEMIKLSVENADWCPRYAGRSIRGVRVKESPLWLKQSLESVGLNSINNIVDVTNYVMMELGQPLHAFDARFLQEGKIIVANSKAGEKFTTLDGTVIELTGDELTIRDGQRPVALAGIVGGLNSGVQDNTQDIFLESAYFAAGPNRRSARRFGIQTDSCYRFSRGTDPEGVVFAMNRACALIQQVAGGEVAEEYYDEYPHPFQRESIGVHKSYIEQRLGYSIEMDDFVQWMKRLSCEVSEGSQVDEFKINAPAFRWDLWTREDLIEEYARLNGYDKIPETFPALSYEPLKHDASYTDERRLGSLLQSGGFSQAINYGFLSKEFQSDFWGVSREEKKWGLRKIDSPVVVENPLSEELGVMRSCLGAGLFKNLLHNYRHGQEYGRLYEIGHVFYQKESFETDENHFGQDHHLGLVAWGQKQLVWNNESQRPPVYDLKTGVEEVLRAIGARNYQWRNIEGGDKPQFLHPGQCASLFYEGQIIGIIGSLHPLILEANKIRHQVALCELNVQKLMKGQPRVSKIKPISKYPSVERDFAFVIPNSQPIGDVISQIEKVGGQLLQKVEVFDEYKGEKIGEGMRSVGFRLTYQDHQETLSEERLTELQQQITNKVAQKLGLQIR